MADQKRPSDERAETNETKPSAREISGPGAADFLTATGGEDLPGFGPNKGMANSREERATLDPKNLVPRPGPDTEAHPGERQPDERKPGSATGTIGGDGPDR